MRTANSECIICKKQFYRRPFELKKVEFVCCRGCRSDAYKRFPNQCRLKNLKLGRKKGTNHLWGLPKSEATKKKIRIKVKRWIKENPDKFRKRVEKLKETKKKNRKGIIRNCLVCSKSFYIFPSWWKKSNKYALCCSKSCAMINKLINKKFPQKDTLIERIIEGALKKENLRYEKQKYFIEAKTIPDFYLYDLNTIIYCDGDYWHSKIKRKNIDDWQTKKLRSFGYKVFRFTETEINKSSQECIKKIKDELCIK